MMQLLTFSSAYSRSSHSSQGQPREDFTPCRWFYLRLKKIKFIQSDLPRPSSDLFFVSGHPPKNSFAVSGRLFSILLSCLRLQDGTQLITFFLIFSPWAYMSCSFLGFLPIWLSFQDLLPPPTLKCRYLPRIFPWFFTPGNLYTSATGWFKSASPPTPPSCSHSWVQSSVPNYLLDVSTWIAWYCFNINMSRIKLSPSAELSLR